MLDEFDRTHFSFPGQINRYEGKVRDVYNIQDTYLVIVSTDRISAFDHILPDRIPYKGQVLNQTAAFFFEKAKADCPIHVVSVPDPNVMIGLKCKAFPIEIIVRAYLIGHAWRVYQSGARTLCGVTLPDGLKEYDPLPEPIITPTTKSLIGHDEDISEQEILKSGMIDMDDYGEIKYHAMNLFRKGAELAMERGLILADTKYEMGHIDGKIYVIDEIHTPDSSRYLYAEGYEERQQNGEHQPQLSKEFVRQWLMEQGFQGKEGQQAPQMEPAFIQSVSDRYVELYETVTGAPFTKRATYEDLSDRIWENTLPAVKQLLS